MIYHLTKVLIELELQNMSKKVSNVWSIIDNMELSTGVKVDFFIANTWWNKAGIFLYRDEKFSLKTTK